MLSHILPRVVKGETLDQEDSARVMQAVISGEEPPARVGALLAALSLRGETAQELAGMARVLRERCRPVWTRREHLLDTCGTGGDGVGTFNVSTLAALVAAGAGAAVAKHGNRAVTGCCGSADVLEELGVNLEQSPEQLGHSLDEAGIAFLYAPALHPALAGVAPLRRQLGFRTVFNLLGPLANPARVRYQLLGVHSPHLTDILARALQELGARRALVVSGLNGEDEVSLSGPTRVTELDEGRLRTYRWEPGDFGLAPAPLAAVQGGGPGENAVIAREILEGRGGPRRDLVLINAAAALLACGVAASPTQGMVLARRSLDEGAARACLEGLARRMPAGDATCS